MNPRIFEIVSAKAELVDEFPRWMLSETTENELRSIEGLAIVEIAGRDSIAAALEATRKRDLKALQNFIKSALNNNIRLVEFGTNLLVGLQLLH